MKRIGKSYPYPLILPIRAIFPSAFLIPKGLPPSPLCGKPFPNPGLSNLASPADAPA